MVQAVLRFLGFLGSQKLNRGFQNRLRGAAEASWVRSIPIHPAGAHTICAPRFSNFDAAGLSLASGDCQVSSPDRREVERLYRHRPSTKYVVIALEVGSGRCREGVGDCEAFASCSARSEGVDLLCVAVIQLQDAIQQGI